MMKQDRYYMEEALKLAQHCGEFGEVPVGAVVVWDDGEIVGRGYNLREQGKNALAHAELMAIDEACKTLGGWRLHKATLYVTLEPCPMCTGAIINSRIQRVVYGAYDHKAGSMGSVIDLTTLCYNHKPVIESGFMEEECKRVLQDFFRRLRAQRKSRDLEEKNQENP